MTQQIAEIDDAAKSAHYQWSRVVPASHQLESKKVEIIDDLKIGGGLLKK